MSCCFFRVKLGAHLVSVLWLHCLSTKYISWSLCSLPSSAEWASWTLTPCSHHQTYRFLKHFLQWWKLKLIYTFYMGHIHKSDLWGMLVESMLSISAFRYLLISDETSYSLLTYLVNFCKGWRRLKWDSVSYHYWEMADNKRSAFLTLTVGGGKWSAS